MVDERNMYNADEMHVIINVDNVHPLGFLGGNNVKYADVVSGGEGFSMVVRFSGGTNFQIESPFMVFTNMDPN